MKKSILFGCLCFVFLMAYGHGEQTRPVAVSPGSESGLVLISQSCPTFSWSAVSWSEGYKVAVFHAVGAEVLTYEEMELLASPIVRKEIKGLALSWTPSEQERLTSGEAYVWYVQAVDASGIGVWSEGRLFQVEEDIRLVGVKEKLRESLKEYGMNDVDIEQLVTKATSGLQEVAVQESSEMAPAYMGVDQGTEGSSNTYYGYLAGDLATGTHNSFFGRAAGYQTTGNYNTFVGFYVGRYNQSGSYNTMMGRGAGKWCFTGSYNTYLGAYAGHNATSSNNTMFGAYAGYSNTSGAYNTMLGTFAGYSSTIGTRNIFLGYGAGYSNLGHYNVFLGYQVGANETGSYKLYIDSSCTAYPLIWGDFINRQIRIHQDSGTWVEFYPGGTKDINIYDGGDLAYCSGTQWVDSSSREVKENIMSLDAEEAMEAFEKLEPVKFNYKRDKEEDSVGFIAEDVPDLVATKDRKGMVAMDVVAVLTKVVQEQRKRDDELTHLVQKQQETIEELWKKINDLEKRK